ncbi:MAG: dTDP-4-dehydrorhamnose 3,5-epimerase, partial [Granulosicoccus sp.]|nr:dTDP-4-dehydrorhamnose 3,5-epimerase [Granulosicoccus sp.]
GLHYADPALSIDWPIPVSQVSDKDQHWPYLVD